MRNPLDQPPEKGPVTCPHCDGDCEEPGAPLDFEGTWMCRVCHGAGTVSLTVAHKYEKDTEA